MKYEYVTVPLLTHATEQILDTWGSEGWELVQVVPAPGGGDQLVAYMKPRRCYQQLPQRAWPVSND